MSQEDHAAAVAEDYRDALDGLTMNSRVEISNLTLIARENTEAAHAIAEVLIDHIKQVVAPRKLPALYLLDSIVKNVGTPYTLFFGRKLYQTFMEAYASVDNGTRRKMDEMLKTWKEPVPGSLDTRPVFPPDTVRPIENALIKARTSALQAQQEQMRSQQQLLAGGRGRPSNGPYRETPTPPGGPRNPYGHAFAPPSGPNGRPPETPVQQGYATHHNPQGMPILSHQPPPSAPAGLIYGPPPGQDGISIDALNSDITQLVAVTKTEIARNPYDAVLQTKLRALLDLQVILQQGSLPRDQLVLVKNQVDELSVKTRAGANAAHALPPQQQQPPAAPDYAARYSTHTPPMVAAPVAPPASAPPAVPLSVDALLGKGALAALLAAGRHTAAPAAPAAPAPPPPQPAVAAAALPAGLAAALRSPPSAAAPAPAPAAAPPAAAADPMALMAMLRSSGLLPPAPAPAAPVGAAGASSSVAPMIAPTPVSLGMSLPGVIAPMGPGVSEPLGDISLNTQSLKRPRLYLIATLHEDLGKPCTQCGRRFRSDQKGKAMKTAHMDWHFRVHQRLAEAEKKGQHRSFYVDPKDWVSSREAIDTDHAADGGPGGTGPNASSGGAAAEGTDNGGATGGGDAKAGGSGGGGGGKRRWIRVPDAGSTNMVCPICQEKFQMQWLEEVQDWVWTDATRVGADRVFHASCHSEVTGGDAGAGAGGRHTRATPEPVLGKRKAESDHRMRNKLKMEPGRINYDELPY